MRVRCPLYAKILLWFFLNLLLLGAVLYGFFRFQFHAGLDSLLAGQIAGRMEMVARMLEIELRETPRTAWDGVMARFNESYDGVEFFLFRPNGTQSAGALVELPPQVRARFPAFRGQIPPAALEGPSRRPRQLALPVPPSQPPRPHPKFMVRTEAPVRYWAGVRINLAKRMAGAPAETQVLLAVSPTLSGGGLFFDAGLWATVGLGTLALSLLLWVPFVRGVTRSVSQITRATEEVAQGNFEVRVDAGRRDELGRLGLAINTMSERLAGFVTGQKRFLGDAAHELCSPLARIELALSLLEAQAAGALQPRIADVREEAREMARLVDGVLAFSRAGLGKREIRLEPVALAEAAARAAGREAPGGLSQMDIPADLWVLAEPGMLVRAVANLVRNAVRHAGGAEPVRLYAKPSGDRVVLTVEDSGPGVPEETLARIFDPFYRLDASRSRETGGFGLGLAIVKSCVEACGGSVVARNRRPSGLEVEITLAATARPTPELPAPGSCC
ncbi:MAG: HAMP domain-containing sensor histidine kinase [Chthoniobacteraceae bacterium]|nr:HAMP domain-containing sensor histidine kinase [Chthoniobacteraceae bacterium]